MKKTQKFVSLVRKAGTQGISVEEMSKKMKMPNARIWSLAFACKKHGVIGKHGKYHYEENGKSAVKTDGRTLTFTPPIKVPASPGNPASPTSKTVLNRVAKLSESDQESFFDSLKRSRYYEKAAKAVLEANEEIDEMKKSILSI